MSAKPTVAVMASPPGSGGVEHSPRVLILLFIVVVQRIIVKSKGKSSYLIRSEDPRMTFNIVSSEVLQQLFFRLDVSRTM